MPDPAPPQSRQSTAPVQRWADKLYILLGEIERFNGPDPAAASKLENLVRYAWDEAREKAKQAEEATPLAF